MGTAAALHFLAWLPDVPGSGYPWQPLLESDRTEHPVREALASLPHELPYFQVPRSPGLGVEVTPDSAAGMLLDTWVAEP